MAKGSMAAVVLLLATPVLAEEGFRHGRFRWVEGGVTVQSATEAGAEQAVANLPFLPGDRVWTDGSGRVEFQFADGSVVRLDGGSKLDYVAHEPGSTRERIVLRLWSGGAYLHSRDVRTYPDFGIETPAGVVEVSERGVYRLDVASGETRLSVYEGEATLEGDGATRVRAGERLYARAGEPVDGPRGFDRAALEDDFARWDAERGDVTAYAARSSYVPEEVAPYAADLDPYGAWRYEPEVGHVWCPSVGPEWHPYLNGRWVWTVFGWTWVGYEPWGWAPFHYGRWGHSSLIGWYWMPGRVWGPAWVSWAVGREYVGWVALGRHDRPVVVRDHGRDRDRIRGHAVPRGTLVTETSPWVYTRRGDVTAPDIARRRLADASEAAGDVRLIESPRARLTREFTPVADRPAPADHAVPADRPVPAERAVPRNVRTRPTPGDTAPELRSDPMTTIPFPVARRRPRDGEPRAPEETREAAGVRTAPRRWERVLPSTTAPPAVAPAAPAQEAHPTDVRAPARREAEPRSRGEGDREVLRPLFRPLAHPRSEEGERAERVRGRSSAEGERPQARPEGEVERERPRPRREVDSDRPRMRPEGDGERPRARPRDDGEAGQRGRRERPPEASQERRAEPAPERARRRKEGSDPQ
jgi:hypothetical protein